MRSFTREDVIDAIELRGVLEGTAARFAAERLESPDELAALSRRARVSTSSCRSRRPAFLRYVELNDAFHTALVGLAKSAPLARALANVAALPFASSNALLSSHEWLPRARETVVVAQHQHRVADRCDSRAPARGRRRSRASTLLAQLNLDLVLADLDGTRADRPARRSCERRLIIPTWISKEDGMSDAVSRMRSRPRGAPSSWRGTPRSARTSIRRCRRVHELAGRAARLARDVALFDQSSPHDRPLREGPDATPAALRPGCQHVRRLRANKAKQFVACTPEATSSATRSSSSSTEPSRSSAPPAAQLGPVPRGDRRVRRHGRAR